MRFLAVSSFFAVVALSSALLSNLGLPIVSNLPLVPNLDLSNLPVVSKLPVVGDLTKPILSNLGDLTKVADVSKLPVVGDLTKPILSNLGDLTKVADVSKLPLLSKLLPGEGLKLSLLSKDGLANLKLGGAAEKPQAPVADEVSAPVNGDGEDDDAIIVRRRDWRIRGLRRPRLDDFPRLRNNVRIPRVPERLIRI